MILYVRDLKLLLCEPNNKDNYYPVKINNVFNNNCIKFKSNGDKDRILSIEEYLDKIRPYSSSMINYLKKLSEWKVHLTKAINFMICNETNEIIKELFDTLLQKYQKDLEESMKVIK